jgi:hypothetical protein
MPHWPAASIVLSLPLLLAPSLVAQSFTLEQVMSAPFNSGLEASPEGKRILWIANEQGRRNLWIADLADGSARRLTNYMVDDGLEISGAHWTPDGKQIVYVHGGDAEFPHLGAPNPALIPEGTDEEIHLVAIDGVAAKAAGKAAVTEPRKLAAGHDPTLSPDGSTLAFQDAAAKAVQLIHESGSPGSLSWSPDGKYLAFRSNRQDHGFIGVYSFAEKSLRYLDASTEIDEQPVWSPDSRSIAFIRIPPDTSGIDFKPRRTAQPWSIRVADVTTGKGQEVGARRQEQAASFTVRNPTISSSGARVIALPSRGREMGGYIFTRSL